MMFRKECWVCKNKIKDIVENCYCKQCYDEGCTSTPTPPKGGSNVNLRNKPFEAFPIEKIQIINIQDGDIIIAKVAALLYNTDELEKELTEKFGHKVIAIDVKMEIGGIVRNDKVVKF